MRGDLVFEASEVAADRLGLIAGLEMPRLVEAEPIAAAGLMRAEDTDRRRAGKDGQFGPDGEKWPRAAKQARRPRVARIPRNVAAQIHGKSLTQRRVGTQ